MRKTTSVQFKNEKLLQQYCKASITLALIKGRWKLSILFLLFEQPCSYQIFKDNLPNITDTVLSRLLNQLIKDKLIVKHKNKDVSSYQLSETGKKLQPLLLALQCYQDAINE